jgi:hypothetical protein
VTITQSRERVDGLQFACFRHPSRRSRFLTTLFHLAFGTSSNDDDTSNDEQDHDREHLNDSQHATKFPGDIRRET